MSSIIITPDSKKPISELWTRRSLVYFFVWRDLKSRYQRTVLGVSWVLLQPLLLAGLFALIGSQRTGLGMVDAGTPVFLVVFLGVSLWQYFETSLTGATNSLGGNYHLLKKVYVPKPLMLLSVVASRALDFALTMLMFLALVWLTGSPLSLSAIGLILLAALVLGLGALAVSLFLAPLSIVYHDVNFALPFVMRVMFFATPLWYSLSILPEPVQRVMMLNPVVAMIEMAKHPFTGEPLLAFSQIAPALLLLAVLLPVGLIVFRRYEPTLVDHL